MNETLTTSSMTKPRSGPISAAGRLFVLEINADRIHVMNPDGSNKKTIVTNCHLPDGIVVDAQAGHIYWTNMGVPNPKATMTDLPGARRLRRRQS